MGNLDVGKFGEELAVHLLTSHKYRIILRNFRCRFGEIDIIALDLSKTFPELVFFEVKTRRGSKFGEPQESIDKRKLKRIRKTALYFLNRAREKIPKVWRVDALILKLDSRRRIVSLKHMKNIFDGN